VILKGFFARIKQAYGIDDDNYWSKCLPWKKPKYDRDKKSHEALRNLKDTFNAPAEHNLVRKAPLEQ